MNMSTEEVSSVEDCMSGIEAKIKRVRQQIEDYASLKTPQQNKKVDKHKQKLHYLEYYRENAVMPVRGKYVNTIGHITLRFIIFIYIIQKMNSF